ncbi:terminase small subunit [Pseudoxanthomonas winnipegensis]|uniref:Terminase small subunit n=2 Tax=Pseudoxanthomonas winnipegensis TaxID=2480810 RepID=A0A4Q8LXG7_9GAMM|nr:terminase small subunit [Pseudoxanthomonas winnipegensis]TAA37238.1 terminase small subunit [Pseudoxanthomonas winnipegensis]
MARPGRQTMPKLTPKQQRFVTEYQKDSNGRQAAIRAGYAPGSAEVQASRLLRNAHVRSEVNKGQARAAKRAEMTLDGHLADLRKLRDAATKKGQFSAAIAAEVARGKASGIHVEHHRHTGAIGTYDLSKLSDDELDRLETILGPLADAGGDPSGAGEAGD